MVLDGDVKQEEGLSLFFVLKLPDDLLKVRLVADVAVLHGLGHVHILAALEAVKAQQGIGLVALPGGELAGVEGTGLVALLPQQGGQRGCIL